MVINQLNNLFILVYPRNIQTRLYIKLMAFIINTLLILLLNCLVQRFKCNELTNLSISFMMIGCNSSLLK